MIVSACGGCSLINSPMPGLVGSFESTVNVALDTVVADALFPIPLAFSSDGTLFYGEKNTGRVRVVTADGLLLNEPFADFAVANPGDEGLLGIALDPEFASNGHVYCAMTTNVLGSDNTVPRVDMRIVRVTAEGLHAQPGSEQVIAVVPSGPLPGHEGGNVHFGPDGKLYLSIGDRGVNGFPNDEAQDIGGLAGRILRYDPDGGIPADNPFGSDNPTYALGLRNPFDFAFDPISGLLYSTDNGPTGDDEFNIITGGENFGWPRVSGMADTPEELDFAAVNQRYVDPLLILGRAPTGIAVNPGDIYGNEFKNDLFVAEYGKGRIKRLRMSADRCEVESVHDFAEGVPGGIHDLAFSPVGIIYISTSSAIIRLIPVMP